MIPNGTLKKSMNLKGGGFRIFYGSLFNWVNFLVITFTNNSSTTFLEMFRDLVFSAPMSDKAAEFADSKSNTILNNLANSPHNSGFLPSAE